MPLSDVGAAFRPRECLNRGREAAPTGFAPFIVLLFTVWLLTWAGPLRAEVAVPSLQSPVTDVAGVLKPEQRSRLEQQLLALQQRKGAQLAVLIVPSVRPETVEQYALRVAESWKLGRKGVDDGALLLVALQERELRIEVGYGLEGVIPDAIAKRVIADVIVPFFKRGDMPGGLEAGVAQLARLIEGEPLPAPRKAADGWQQLEDFSLVSLLAVFIVGGLLRAMLGAFMGGLVAGGITTLALWWWLGSLVVAGVAGVAVFFMVLLGVSGLSLLSGGRGGGRLQWWRWWIWRRRRFGEMVMDWKRFWRHALTTRQAVRRAFPPAVLAAVEEAVRQSESRHMGEIRFVVEAALEPAAVLKDQTARERALEVFSQLRVWDTEHNSGVLVYLLLADRQVEIVADRGIHHRAGDAAWQDICRDMEQAFAAGRFGEGAQAGIRAIGKVLAAHVPAQEDNPDELDNQPTLL